MYKLSIQKNKNIYGIFIQIRQKISFNMVCGSCVFPVHDVSCIDCLIKPYENETDYVRAL